MAGLDGLMSGLDHDERDQFQLDDPQSRAPEVALHHPPFFPEQAYLGGLIVERIKLILEKCHHPSRSLDDFNKFDYEVIFYSI